MSLRTRQLEVDIAVIGGGLGGVAAALAAAEAGATVVLSDEYAWLGGQVTSQGVSALDEHPHIEHFGGTRSYCTFRELVRQHYRTHYGAPASMPDGRPLNPGNGWVSQLCFEPRVGLQVIETLLEPHVTAGRLTILTRHRPIAVDRFDECVLSVRLLPLAGGPSVDVRALYFLDATELGDLLPLAQTAYVTGAESQDDTGEPLARPEGPAPGEVQSFTLCFAVEFCPGATHRQRRPPGYLHNRAAQPYSFTLHDWAGHPRPFRMFAEGEGGLLPFWSYRRLIDSRLLNHPAFPNDIALINWHGNDYAGASLLDKPVQLRKQALAAARNLSLGFLHWLQTAAPRDDGGCGYPELKLRPDLMGTTDGLAQAPYIRESRRLLACTRVVEQDIRATANPLARARRFDDTVGIGWYPLDLHPAVGNPRSLFEPTRPYQIPLGALHSPGHGESAGRRQEHRRHPCEQRRLSAAPGGMGYRRGRWDRGCLLLPDWLHTAPDSGRGASAPPGSTVAGQARRAHRVDGGCG